MKNGGGQFTPKLGGHFELKLGGQYHWNLQLLIIYAPNYAPHIIYVSKLYSKHAKLSQKL
ncbi:MAG: hypothetical protein APF83_11520 [Lutibacter sp. BRH_c52]|nr:MAG: hypothetical protein APF83_11520 [Lutibacter sp. BRH_c52]